MTNQSNIQSNLEAENSGSSDLVRAIKIGLASIVYLIAFGIMIASQGDMLEQYGKGVALVAILGAATAIIVITIIWAKAIGMVAEKDEPVSESTAKSQKSLLLAGLFGAVIGAGFILSGDLREGGAQLFSNQPIAPVAAIVFGVLYSVATIWGSFRWNKTADEHEKAAATSGAYAGIYTYAVLAPVWWLAERASLAPPQQPMIVFAIVLTVYAAVWTYKRGE